MLSPAAARRLIVASSDWQPARDRARHLAGSLTGREAQVLACLGEGLPDAQIAARLYRSEARVKGYVSRMLDKLGCANRAPAGLLARGAPVSSAGSPGGRSCRLELGLGARQAGLRPSPGRSCPPGAAGLTGASRPACCRGSGCRDHSRAGKTITRRPRGDRHPRNARRVVHRCPANLVLASVVAAQIRSFCVASRHGRLESQLRNDERSLLVAED